MTELIPKPEILQRTILPSDVYVLDVLLGKQRDDTFKKTVRAMVEWLRERVVAYYDYEGNVNRPIEEEHWQALKEFADSLEEL